MSPKRLEGKEADARSDIFSFGCVLLEMLTGRRAFTGDKPAQLISAIVTKDPLACAPLVSPLPPALVSVIPHCLEKRPEDRFQTARDLAFALEALSAGSATSATAPALMPGGARRCLAWGVAALPVVGLAAVSAPRLLNPSVGQQRTILALLPPDKTSFNTVAVSPDGQQLALTARDTSGTIQLWVRAMDSLSARPLAGTEGAVFPFWSSDSRFIAITAGSILKRIEPPASRGESPLQQGFALRNDQHETAYAGCVESLTLVPQQSLCVRRIQDEALAVITAVVPGNLGGAIQDARSY